MAPWNLPKPVPSPPPPSLARRVADRIRGSTWIPIAIRAVGVVLALLVLGWIGRSAAAGGLPAGAPPPGASGTVTDASAPLVPPVSTSADAGAGALVPIVPSVAVSPAGGARSARATPSEPVYINHASVDELRRLPGVGPKRAESIVAVRQRLGRFQRVEDLLRVKGVGRSTVKKWRPLLRLDAPAPPGGDGGSL